LVFAKSGEAIMFVAVSDGADDIWRIDKFNGAFAKTCGRRTHDEDGSIKYSLPVAFAARLGDALYRCSTTNQTIGFSASLSRRSIRHSWQFLLDPVHGFGRPWRHILVHGHEVTGEQNAARDIKYITRKLLSAQEDERRRIARDLHDSTAQHLVALGIGITHLEILANQPSGLTGHSVRHLVADMRATLSRAHDEIRTLSLLLHPPELDGAQIADALRRFVAGFARRTGIQARLSVERQMSCDSTDAATALMRIAQEALANVYRHAGATEVTVELRSESSVLVLTIEDNGKGFASGAAASATDDSEMIGVGISGMRARVRQLGGDLFLKNGDRGALIVATIPQRNR
jgi:signal transduction histidine kinase